MIYLDVLLAINLAVDYLLLFAAARLCGTGFSRLRGLMGAVLGAVSSLMILADIPGYVFTAAGFVQSALMVMVAFGRKKPTEFLRLLVIFHICGFLFSGFMMLINTMTRSEAVLLKGGAVYFELSAMEIVISGTAAFVVTEIFRRLFRKKEPEGNFIAKVFYEGRTAVLKGFTDTGNSLSDPISGAPAAVANPDSFERILPEGMLSSVRKKEMSTEYRMRYIPCKTISGSVLIPAFRPDKIEIINEKGEFFADDILIAVSENAPENTLIIGSNVILKSKNKFFSEV